MKIKILFATLIAFALAAAGCSSLDPESGRSHLGYIPARFYDLLDIVELNVGFNPGINSYIVGAIEPLAVGVGHYRSEKYGMDGRLLGHWTEKRSEIDLLLDSFIQYQKTPRTGNGYLFDSTYHPFQNNLATSKNYGFWTLKDWGMTTRFFDDEKHFLDVSAEVHFLSIGIDVGFSLKETFDFAAGILGVDAISNDDWAPLLPTDGTGAPLEETLAEIPPETEDSTEPEAPVPEEIVEEPIAAVPEEHLETEPVPPEELLPEEETEEMEDIIEEPTEPAVVIQDDTYDESDPAEIIEEPPAPEPVEQESGPAPPAESGETYESLVEQTDFRNPEQVSQLAGWCMYNNHELLGKRYYRKVLTMDPNHSTARKMLGYERVGERWILKK